MSRNKPKILESKLFFAFVFLLSSILLFSPFFFEVRFAQLQSLGLLGIAIINFISSATILLPAPGFIATGIGGSLYNPILVALASSAGASLGEGVGFVFGHSSRKISNSSTNKYFVLIENIIHHKHGGWLIVLLAFIPNPFFDVVGIAAGAALFPLKRFLLLVFAGRFARDIIIAYAGSII
jgi:membrane protein YqaA with SNARE-associated domain